MNMKELDARVIKQMSTYHCPKCGQELQAVIIDGAVVAFDCLGCQETFSFGNIYCT